MIFLRWASFIVFAFTAFAMIYGVGYGAGKFGYESPYRRGIIVWFFFSVVMFVIAIVARP